MSAPPLLRDIPLTRRNKVNEYWMDVRLPLDNDEVLIAQRPTRSHPTRKGKWWVFVLRYNISGMATDSIASHDELTEFEAQAVFDSYWPRVTKNNSGATQT